MNLNKVLIAISCFFLLMACQEKKATKKVQIVTEVPSNFEMYKTSEMAELMRTMLAKNKELRERIIKGENIGDFNAEFIKVHSAKLTDSTDLDATFPTYANHFILMQKSIFSVEKSKQKEQFNNAINACVACHVDRCSGPIPRIKRLIIK
ncbi:MAG: hypothetical protein ACPGUU_02685 [Flavobacteriaceae bacterium]